MTTSEKTPPAADKARAPIAPSPGSALARIPGFGRPTVRFVHRWAIALLVANVGITVTGGAVRLTGSGLGCPTWPQCTSGSFVPHEAMGYHAAIEFSNRMLTWVLIVVAIATWIAVWRQASATTRNRTLVTLLALGIPFQGVVGGITVLTDLNPWIVALHFLLSMLLVSGSTVLVFRTTPYPRELSTPGVASRGGLVLAWLVYAVTWIAIYLGTVVTGSGPHAGDVKAPRNGLTPSQVTQLHADSVFVLVGLTVAVLVLTRVMRMPQSRAALIYAVLLVLQGVIGVVQYVTDLPILLVLAHMLGSALLLIGATWLVLWFRRSEQASDDEADPTPVA
ncbi:COX15/CtaA family protein [Gordonia sp. DT219]|uniref:COX15/CtaA family protein n=1 Tax=Gordonia sp. DT219 TaxID=3416658 RepID=UPI003CE81923